MEYQEQNQIKATKKHGKKLDESKRLLKSRIVIKKVTHDLLNKKIIS